MPQTPGTRVRTDLLAVLLIAVCMCGCDSGEALYEGTAETTIDYLEYTASGALVPGETVRFTAGVQVIVGPPRRVGLVSEENAFSLNITTAPTTGEEGELWLTSSIVLVDEWLGEILLQYWTLSLTGTRLTGTLTDTHIAESAAMNQLWARDEISPGLTMIMPFPIATGAAIEGTLTDSKISATITGTTTDGRRPFVSKITARHTN